MALVTGIGDGFEIVAIAPGAADILRRASPYRFDETRIEHPLGRRGDRLDRDPVLPVVAEIVDVLKGLLLPRGIGEEIAERRLSRRKRAVAPRVLGIGGSPRVV